MRARSRLEAPLGQHRLDMTRPGTNEYASYYEGYVSKVPGGRHPCGHALGIRAHGRASIRIEPRASRPPLRGREVERQRSGRAHHRYRADVRLPCPLLRARRPRAASRIRAGRLRKKLECRKPIHARARGRATRREPIEPRVFLAASTKKCGRAAGWRVGAPSRCALSPISSWATSCTTAAFSKAATFEPVVSSRGS